MIEIEMPSNDLLDVVERPFVGKIFAYVATQESNLRAAYRLSIVVDGESGHYPMTNRLAYGDEAGVRKLAEWLNRERLRLPDDEVTRVVTRSFRSERSLRRGARAQGGGRR